jgi:GT2 family glycosyltransferase
MNLIASPIHKEATSATQTQVDISVIVVTLDRSDLLQSCLSSLLRTASSTSVEVIVVDNGSTDDSLEMLKDKFRQVRVIANPTNLGFAKANNQAIPLCRGRYVVLLNNDTIVLDGAIQSLLEFMDEHPSIGCVGPQLLNADGSIQPSYMRFPSLVGSWRNFVSARTRRGAKPLPRMEGDFAYVDAVSGACMMLRKVALDDVGLLDEGYFMYAEETDWCYRAKQAGWRTAYYPAGQVIHLGEQTAHKEPARFYVERRYSRVRYYSKHHGPIVARLDDWMIRLVILGRWGLARGNRRAYYRQIASLYHKRIEELNSASGQ